MRITRPDTGEYIETHCTGCMCHDLPMQFGDLDNGCCTQCGCPKNLTGWNYWKKKEQEKLKEDLKRETVE